MTANPPARTSTPVLALCGLLWCGSYLVPLYLLPITVFASLWMAILVWGLALSASTAQGASLPRDGRVIVMSAVLLGLAGLAMAARVDQALVLLATAAVFLFGASENDERWLRTLLWGVLAAGMASVAIAGVQIFLPGVELPGIAPLANPGRATANLRQPNLLASLLLMSLTAAVALQGMSKDAASPGRSRLWIAAAAWLGLGVAFSQARTGFLCIVLLLVWAAFDRRLPRSVRAMPWAMAAGCLVGLALVAANAHFGQGAFYLERHAALSKDISSSRFGIWANSLALIAQHPLWGVGWGHFAKAWALTPFPDRPVAAFDHAHNLPLQLAVELGVPLALLVLGGFAWVVWRSRTSWLRVAERRAPLTHGLWMMLAMLGVHSLLEYPLWYSYFLLPAAFVLGTLVRESIGLEASAAVDAGHAATAGRPALPMAALRACGVLIVLGSLYAAWDYGRVLQAFSPFGPGLRKSLEQRVEEGRRSVLFGAWVDYGVITNAEDFKDLNPAIQRAMLRNLNPHLLLVYAQSLHARGEDDKARYVVARLREFRHPISAEFLAACDQQPAAEPRPFQCLPPETTRGLRDLD